MRRPRYLGAALAASLAFLLTACGGSGEPQPDLAVVSTRDGDYAIHVIDADGARRKRLTENDLDPASPAGLFFQIEPAWSPDGGSLAFASKRGGSFDLFVMNADGTRTRRLTSGNDDEGHPTWSPDGRRIAFHRGDSGNIYVMNVDGSGARAITEDPALETHPAWSPDGRWIVHVRRQPGTEVRELWLVRLDGSDARRLTNFRTTTSGPSWSPDSRRIVFAANIDGAIVDIYSIGVDGKGLRRHTQSTEDAFEPSWSPDGATIAFSRAGSIVTVTLEGNVEVITDAENNDSSPAWNPRPPQEED
jgi:TolB protein